MFKHIILSVSLLFSLSFLMFGSSDVEPPSGWEEPAPMTFSMSVTAQVLDGDTPLEWPSSQLAVFDNRGVCRGVGVFNENTKRYPVTVTSEMQNAEYLYYRLLNSQTGSIQEIAESLEFQSGTALADVVLHLSQGQEPPRTDAPEWTCNASDFDTRRMNIYATVSIDDELVATPGSMLAAFQGDTCVGVAYLNPSYPTPYTAALSVANDASKGTAFTMQVYDAGTGATEEVDWNTPFSTSGEYGTIIAPLALTAGAIPCELTFSQGYTWFSLNGTPADGMPGTVLSGLTISNNDLIQKQEGSPATYYNGKWFSAFQLEPGVMYALKKSAGGTETITVKGKKAEMEISVKAGAYKWFGVMGKESWLVSALSHSAGFANNDLVQKQDGSPATYFSSKWYGGFELRPGVGYVIRCANAGTITTVVNDTRSEKGLDVRGESSFPWSCQWDNFDTRRMNIFAVVKAKGQVITAIGSQLAAFQDDICVGTAEITEEEYPVVGTFPLAVCNMSEKGNDFTLKVYDASTGEKFDVDWQGTFNTAAPVSETGSIGAPLEMNFVNPTPGHWDWPEVQAYRMTLKANVTVNGVAVDVEKSQLAAFDSHGVLCGISTVENGSFQMTIYSDTVDEEGLTFKVYDASSDTEYAIPGSADFTENGSYKLGFAVTSGENRSARFNLQKGWNLVGIPLHLDSASREILDGMGGYRYNAEQQAFTKLDLDSDMLSEACWLHAEEPTVLELNGTAL